MLLKETTATYSQDYMKPMKTFCGENAIFLIVKRVVHTINTGFKGSKRTQKYYGDNNTAALQAT
jgi:hypothetical protein